MADSGPAFHSPPPCRPGRSLLHDRCPHLWNRTAVAWGDCPLDAIAASDAEALQRQIAAIAQSRRNSRSGRHAGEHVIIAVRAGDAGEPTCDPWIMTVFTCGNRGAAVTSDVTEVFPGAGTGARRRGRGSAAHRAGYLRARPRPLRAPVRADCREPSGPGVGRTGQDDPRPSWRCPRASSSTGPAAAERLLPARRLRRPEPGLRGLRGRGRHRVVRLLG